MRTPLTKRTPLFIVMGLAIVFSTWISSQEIWAHDADEDGVIDELDACPDSLTNPTVVLAGQDSGVRNVPVGEGCTPADRVVACSLECPTLDGEINENRFASCTRRLTRELVREGVLTREEREALVSFVAAQALCSRTKLATVKLNRAGHSGQGCTMAEAKDAAREGAGQLLCVGANDVGCGGQACLNQKTDECVTRTKAPFDGCAFSQVDDTRCTGPGQNGKGFICTIGARPANQKQAEVECICECRRRPS
jgi:hypothetical protein